MIKKILQILTDEFYFINKNVISLNNIEELKRLKNWNKSPVLDKEVYKAYKIVPDLNERKLKDAESILTICCNINAINILEIGTAFGDTTLLLAMNAPNATIHTINIPPDEAKIGKGGKNITAAFSEKEIGKAFKDKGLKNINQIYVNTATWKPDIGEIDFAFIDGCHDKKFVINDTIKILKFLKPGGFILWHDFNPDLRKKYSWIGDVCKGIEALYRRRIIKGQMFHVKDSWVGIYQKD